MTTKKKPIKQLVEGVKTRQKAKPKAKNSLDNAQIRNLFPTPLIIGDIPDITLCDRLEKAIRKEMKSGRGNYEAHNGVVYATDDQLHAKGRGFEELVDLVMGETKNFMDWLHLKRDGHKIVGMWSHVVTKHHRHPVHTHPNSYISGVIYVRVPTGSGNLAFSDPRPAARVFEPEYNMYNEFNSGVYSHQPAKGTMLLWPSWMPHSVEQGPVAEGEERIVIAFNVQMIGKSERHTAKMKLTKG